jgi:3-deoxy-D-manno-octulosonic-acid transferase
MAAVRLGRGLPERPGPSDRQRVLVHGVSVGEVKAAQSVIAELARTRPELEVLVSTTTDTGFEVARQLYPSHRIVRFPVDVSFIVRRFLKRVSPCAVVLLELEVWPNFMRVANRIGVPVAVVNGRITDKSFGTYRLFRRLLPQFSRISLFCVQDGEYADRFLALGAGPGRVLVTGNVKVDSLKFGTRSCRPELVRLLGGAEGQKVLVAGSTHEPEERWLVDAWKRGAPEARLVLVPRHPGRAQEIVRDLAAGGTGAQLLTALRRGDVRPDPSVPAIVDTIGELEQVYVLSDVVFVGGSLIPHGGQNMLEPAAQGRPVVYGPHVTNFAQEAALLERAGASVRVEGPEALVETLRTWSAEPETLAAMSRAGRDAVESQKGATALTLAALTERCLPAVELS